jgi:hypothetical protein
MVGLSCRFYKNRFPTVEDVVMVNVRSIAEMGAYVDLSEYNNIEGNYRSNCLTLLQQPISDSSLDFFPFNDQA